MIATLKPTISVGMPVFNGDRYLVAAIDSILAQTHQDFELIISDNASTDRTCDICQDYVRRDPRVRYFRQPSNQGAPRNFNFVFEQARGEYFKWASANDLCHPDLLRQCKAVLDDRPEVVLCFGKALAIDGRGEVLRAFEENFAVDDPRPSRRFAYLFDQMGMNNVHAGLFRVGALRKTAPEDLYPGADLVLIAELALYGLFVQVPQILFYRREVPGTATRFRSASEIIELRTPGVKPRWYWPLWRTALGYVQAARRSPLAAGEKREIFFHLLLQFARSRRDFWRELCSNLWR